MEFTAPETIEKYVSINVLSRDNAYFLPSESDGKSVQCKLTSFTGTEIKIETAVPLARLDGVINFYSYHLLMCFPALLRPAGGRTEYCCDVPGEIVVDERRQFPRVRFESDENKTIKITCRNSRAKYNAVLFNLSASGLGFYLTDTTVQLEVGQTLYFDFDMLGVTINRLGRVQYQEGSLVGCKFLYVKPAFMTRVHQVIFKEIEWRSDRFLAFLLEKKEMVNEFRERLKGKGQLKDRAGQYLETLGPFLNFSISMINSFFDIQLQQREVRFDMIVGKPYDAIVFFEGRNRKFKFQFLLCATEPVLLKMCKLSHGIRSSYICGEVENLIGEAGRMIVENAGDHADSSRYYNYSLTPPSLILGQCQGICSMSSFPCIRITYDSPFGDFEVVILIDEQDELPAAPNGQPMDGCFSKNLELIEPIYNSLLDIFTNFLHLDIKETAAVVRSPMVTPFEISAIQDLLGKEIEGKVVLNVSESLALNIYEQLFHQSAKSHHAEPVEMVGEILKKVMDKACEGFRELGRSVRMSTPLIIKGKKYTIRNIDNQPFLSSHYRTPAGEFQFGYTVLPR